MISRIWFPQAPGGDTLLQSYQLGIGYPLNIAIIPPEPPIIRIDPVAYYRRYLNDTAVVQTGPTTISSESADNSLTSYYRRYLNDPRV